VIVVARNAADAAKRSADAASLQARAMVGAELPRFELGHVHLACSDQSVRQAVKAPSIDLRFTSYGRTTALVLEKCIEVRLDASAAGVWNRLPPAARLINRKKPLTARSGSEILTALA
jgi:hypothetical protein